MINNVECDYKGKCTSYPHKCYRCVRNRGKRDYFIPDDRIQKKWEYRDFPVKTINRWL